MKKQIFFCLVGLAIIILIPFNTMYAQPNIKALLSKDIVKVENGTYSIQEFGVLATFEQPLLVKITATTPVSLLSRDNFLRFYGALSTSILSTYLSQEGKKVPNDLHLLLSEPTGSPVDIEVTITMNERGVDYVVITKNVTSKMDLQWLSQLYLDN